MAANFVCQPPVRTDADREALWGGLGAESVGVISTDHCPFTVADRRGGVTGAGWTSFAEIPGGQPGVETRLGLAYQGVRDGLVLRGALGRPGGRGPGPAVRPRPPEGRARGRLDADLVVFDPEATRRLDAASLHMRTDHSPYAGLEVRGWPAVTIARGRIVARDGEPADVEPGWGRFVPRGRSTALG